MRKGMILDRLYSKIVKEEYVMFDKTINLDMASLPKLLQNTINEMEEYEKKVNG